MVQDRVCVLDGDGTAVVPLTDGQRDRVPPATAVRNRMTSVLGVDWSGWSARHSMGEPAAG